MSTLGFFLLLSLFYGWISLKTGREVWRVREDLFDARLTAGERELLDRAAFFLLVPLGVLLHEIGHALAVLQVGAEILQFRWFLFLGYVVHSTAGVSALANWWIALAGNLLGVLLGLAALALLLAPLPRPWFYLTWSFARLQLFYSLVFYPAFSKLTGFGDWVSIYSAEGGAWAWITFFVHLFLLVSLGLLFRHGRFRAWLVERYAPEQGARLNEIIARDAESADDWIQLGAYYAEQGEARLAERAFERAEALDPTDPRPPLNRARMAQIRGRHDRALSLYAQGLALTQDIRLRAFALSGMAEAELAHYRAEAALEHVDAALALSPADPALAALREQILQAAGRN